MSTLRRGGIGKSKSSAAHSEASDPFAVRQVRPIAELQSEAESFGRHPVAVVKNPYLLNPVADACFDLPFFLNTDHLDIFGIGLNGIVDQFRQRIGGVLISAVAHRPDGQFRGNDFPAGLCVSACSVWLIPNVLPVFESLGDASEAGQMRIDNRYNLGFVVSSRLLASRRPANHLAVKNE